MKQLFTNVLLLTIPIFLFGQNVDFTPSNFKDQKVYLEIRDNLLDGNDNYKDKYFIGALPFFFKAYSYNQNNAELNFKIGECYLHTGNKTEALKFLQSSYKLDSTYSPKIHLELGTAYQYVMDFDNAIKEYLIYAKIIGKIDENLEKKIQECNTGKQLVLNPIKGKIHNLEAVNSEYSEYSPMISADENMLIFTSRRENTKGGDVDPFDLEFYEDIYFSNKIDNIWTAPEPISGRLNTGKHDSNAGLSFDGKKLYIYRSNNNGDLFESNLTDNSWSSPKPISEPINSKYTETSIAFSADGKTVYFVSNRPNGKGGKDIWTCKINEDNTFGKAINLGETINTKFDEDGVFIHPNGKTIFFSSKGHNTMGNYDIFKSNLDSTGQWTTPENIGYPINSTNDDIFFFLSANGKTGYFSSIKENGLGNKDIYYINFDETDVGKTDANLTLVKGRILDAKTKEPLSAKIEIVNNKTQTIDANFTSDQTTGEFIISLVSGINYGLSIEKNGYLFYSLNFDLVDSTNFNEIVLEVGLPDTCVNSSTVMRNIFFDYGKTILKAESKHEIEKVYNLLKKYPTMKLEISGHTDNVSSLRFNQKLSINRAKAVAKFLIDMGIEKNRLLTTGYAFSRPIADNSTIEGQRQNRRVELKILGY